MKINCGIAKDLLPLYVDDICTQESRESLEEHLKNCEVCREKYKRMTKNLGLDNGIAMVSETEVQNQEKKFKKGMKKIRRRWFMSLIAVFMVIPILWGTVNQVCGEGICFTNLYQVVQGYRYLSALRDEEYEKAFDMMDAESAWKVLTEFEPGIDTGEYEAKIIDGKIWYSLKWDAYSDKIPAAEKEDERVMFENEAERLDFWENILEQSQTGVFIVPEEVYRQLKKEGRLPVLDEGGTETDYIDIVKDSDGTVYYAGSYYNSVFEGCSDDKDKIYSIRWDAPVVPEPIWKEINDVQKEIREEFEKTAKQYKDMGYEQWKEESKQHFIRSMEQFAKEYGEVSQIRLHAVYRSGYYEEYDSGRWQMEYDISFGKAQIKGGIILFAESGKLIAEGGGYSYEFPAASSGNESALDEFLNIVNECWILK